MTQLESDIAVVTSYFNPLNYRSRWVNLGTFLAAMDGQLVAPHVAEIAFRNRTHDLSDHPRARLFRCEDVLWHKESLIGAVVRELPPRYTKVAWLDADVMFLDPSWWRSASDMLDDFKMLQLFSDARHVTRRGSTWLTTRGIVKHINEGLPDAFQMGKSGSWPGLAWAARREVIDDVGFLDCFVLGGADTYMALAAFGAWDNWHEKILPSGLQRAWSAWAQRLYPEVRGAVGYIPGEVVQLGHGSIANRGYLDRFEILRRRAFDPDVHLVRRPDGILSWTPAAGDLARDALDYFIGRAEDE